MFKLKKKKTGATVLGVLFWIIRAGGSQLVCHEATLRSE